MRAVFFSVTRVISFSTQNSVVFYSLSAVYALSAPLRLLWLALSVSSVARSLLCVFCSLLRLYFLWRVCCLCLVRSSASCEACQLSAFSMACLLSVPRPLHYVFCGLSADCALSTLLRLRWFVCCLCAIYASSTPFASSVSVIATVLFINFYIVSLCQWHLNWVRS